MININHYKVLYLILLTFIVLIIYVNLNQKPLAFDYKHLYIDEVLLDNRAVPSQAEIIEGIAREIPSSPIEFWQRNHIKKLQLNESCARYPRLLDLQYYNTYWQIYKNLNLTYYLYGAYYDNRSLVATKTPLVRILVLANHTYQKFPNEYCQMWFDETTKPVIVSVTNHNDLWYPQWAEPSLKLKRSFPVLINCEVPKAQRHLIPQAISLVTRECATASNNLKVTYEPLKGAEKKSRFAVCVKAMWFPFTDESARLIEWLEMLRILGAEKVTIYNLQTHPNNTRVLEYYHRQGFVDYPSYTLTRSEPNTPNFGHMERKTNRYNHRLEQVIQLNDCFYRNMYRYDYIALMDVDELIMPVGNLNTWHDIMAIAEKIPHKYCNKKLCCSSCYCFRNVYFPRYPYYDRYTLEVPKYMYMLQHVRRVREHLKIGMATKCFHNTDIVFAVHNHYPRHSVKSCYRNQVNVSIGQMQHYREPDKESDLNDPVFDNNIWRFNETLIARSFNVLRKLGYFQKKYRKSISIK